MSDHRPLRLVETPPRYPPFIGGVENVAQAVCSRLAAQGDDVTVICADEPHGAPDRDLGVRIRRLPWRFKIANTNITIRLPLVLARTKWDVVGTHLPTPWSADWSILIARLLGRGSVLNVHTTVFADGRMSLIARLYMATLFRITLRLADRVIVLSDFWRDELLALDPSVGERIRVIPNGVDLNRFSPGAGGNGAELLFVGVLDKFHRLKGLDTLLEAMTQAKCPCRLTVVGDGELREEYEQLALELGLQDRVRFLGAADPGSELLLRAYRTADLFVLPSRGQVGKGQEGLPLAALEAMASGLPVILADGVGEFARDAEVVGAGAYIPANDSTALSAVLDGLLGDPKRRASMGGAARALVQEHYSWDALAQQRRAMYVQASEAAIVRRTARRRLWPSLLGIRDSPPANANVSADTAS